MNSLPPIDDCSLYFHSLSGTVAASMKYFVVAGLLMVIANLSVGERGLPALLQSRREAMQLTAQISALRVQNAALMRQVRALKNDPAAIETEARKTLGLIHPGEIVVRLTAASGDR